MIPHFDKIWIIFVTSFTLSAPAPRPSSIAVTSPSGRNVLERDARDHLARGIERILHRRDKFRSRRYPHAFSLRCSVMGTRAASPTRAGGSGKFLETPHDERKLGVRTPIVPGAVETERPRWRGWSMNSHPLGGSSRVVGIAPP